MVIPEDKRATYVIPLPSKTVPELKAAICEFLATSKFGATPLRQVNNRYGGTATRLNVRIQDVLNEMVADGLIASRRFPTLNRTFLFTAADWMDCLAEIDAGKEIWVRYEVTLKDVK